MTNMTMSPLVRQVADEIRELCPVEKIFLFNEKRTVAGETTAFKLCLILDTHDKAEIERRLYLAIDCDVPYDLLIYTPAQWEHLKGRTGSFAQHIAQTGSEVDG